MAFFTETDRTGGTSPFEPKRKFRWTVSFSNMGNNVTYMAKTMNKPSITTTPTEHQFLNHIFKYPNRPKWENINLTFIDSFQANMSTSFYNIMRGSGYQQPTIANETLTGWTKANMVAALGTVTLRQLDGGSTEIVGATETANLSPSYLGGNIRDEWVLKNAQLVSIKFGEGMTYAEDALVEVAVTLAYDYATYTEFTPGTATFL